jgi:PAS domain S-box-containing protein
MRKFKVLIIDDIDANIFALTTVLEKNLNFDIKGINSAPTALSYIDQHSVDLILCDVQMPDMDGFEFVSIIRLRKKTAHIPVIFVSAHYNEKIFFQKACHLGALDYLIKPIDEEELVHRLNTYYYFAMREHKKIVELDALNQKLLAANELMRLIDTANAPIFGIDSDGRVNEWNRKSTLITGYNKAEVIGRCLVSNFIVAEHKLSVHAVLEKALIGEENVNFQFPLLTKGGSRVDVLLSSTTRRGADGQIVGMLGVGQDITEQKRLRLEQDTIRHETDKAKAQFISTVSHELRTPLTSIKGALGLIQAGVLDNNPEKRQQVLDIAYDNTGRLHKLIDKILDLEKLESSKESLVKKTVNLSALLQQSLVANAGYGSEYDVTFAYSGADEPLWVNGDYDSLMQVMGNLLSNAVKFSPSGGEVQASVGRHLESLRVVVKDDGCGIPEGARKTIFDKFTQTNASKERQRGGSGLGLNIAKQIVEGHDGLIDYTSEVGKGTTFYVDLPELEVGDAE